MIKMDKKELIEKTYLEHVKQLNNLGVVNDKLLICFSGIPGSGKTTIAKILEERYKAVRIRGDDIRKILKSIDSEADLDEDLNKYIAWFFENYSFKNKLIVLDSGIDRRYEQIIGFAENEGFEVFIIRLEVSREILEKRIFDKKNCRDPHFDSEIDRWEEEWRKFGEIVESHVILKNEGELSLDEVFGKLDNLIK